MTFQLDIRVTELLCARLCHDLIGPIAAINNGIELVTDFGDGMQDDAMALVGESAMRASALLQFYRAAFGSAQGGDGRGIGLGEARDRALEALTSDRISLDWPSDHATGGHSRLAVKLVLNLVLLATEILPGAGTIEIRILPGSPTTLGVTAKKEALELSRDFSAVLEGQVGVDDLTPHTVLAYLARALAESLGAGLEVKSLPNAVSFSVVVTD